MTEKQKEFLEKLNKLMQEYNASFGYTTDDDGVHVSVGELPSAKADGFWRKP